MPDLYPDDADVVRKSVALRIFANVGQDPVEKFLWRKRGMTADTRPQLLLTEERSGSVLDLEKPVGKEHDHVALRH